MTLQYAAISNLDEQLVQRKGDHLVSVDMSEPVIEDRTKRIHPENVSIPNLKYMVTQVGHPFGVLSPVYFDATDGLWKGARANDRDTLCTHVVVYVDGDEFLVAEQGTFRITHGLALGYWFLSDTIAGALVDEPGVINNPVLYAMDAETVRVLSVGEVVSPTGGGASAQPVYLSVTDSDVAGYKTLSYDMDASTTEVAQSTADAADVYLYPLGLNVDSLPSGPYYFQFKAKVNSTAGVTYLRVTAFVRDELGMETDLFTADTDVITSTSYMNVAVRVVEPAYLVGDTDRFGIRVEAITTHALDKTVTYQLGDGYGAYITTPIALRHNLLRGRNEADSHPASAITVSDPVTPDYTAPQIGDTMQDVTNKMAGLQDLGNTLKELIQKDQWFDLYLNAANTAVTGSAVVTLQPKGSFARTLETSGSTAMIYLSRNSGYSNGQSYYNIDWSKNIILNLYIMRQDVGTTESDSWAFLGSFEGDPIADPAQKGIGLKIVNKAVSGICHNGTTMNSISLGDAVNTQLFGVTIHSKGDGNVDYYFNSSFVGTCTGGPTGLSKANATSLRFLIQSIVGDSIMGIFTIKMYAEQ
ncbi:MAG: hypothetical protein EOM68_07215 [Spirochaetia bacterium]|nr:hypothetical protein [Spirochaetia bacterium]